MDKEEIKDLVQSAADEVLSDLKENFKDYIISIILPTIEERQAQFIEDIKTEISETSSIWVKIRNSLLIVIINIVAKIIKKALEKMSEVD